MTEAAITPPSLLSAEVCSNCGYSLVGLPNDCVCPECGKTIDRSEIVLHGFACGRDETAVNAKRSRLVWVTFSAVAVGGWNVMFNAWLHPRFSLFLIPLAFLPTLYLLFRRSQVDHPGLVLRMTW